MCLIHEEPALVLHEDYDMEEDEEDEDVMAFLNLPPAYASFDLVGCLEEHEDGTTNVRRTFANYRQMLLDTIAMCDRFVEAAGDEPLRVSVEDETVFVDGDSTTLRRLQVLELVDIYDD